MGLRFNYKYKAISYIDNTVQVLDANGKDCLSPPAVAEEYTSDNTHFLVNCLYDNLGAFS
jgi:hypothetical protein